MKYNPTPAVSNSKGTLPTNFLSEKQAAEYLTMSVSWLRKCRDLGIGPVWMKFGNSVRYPTDALMAYVRQSTRNFTGEYCLPPTRAPRNGGTID